MFTDFNVKRIPTVIITTIKVGDTMYRSDWAYRDVAQCTEVVYYIKFKGKNASIRR